MSAISKKLYIFLSFTPLLCLTIFYLFVIRAYFALGRFPKPYQPDPKDLDFGGFHMWGILLSTLLVFAAIIPWVYATTVLHRERVISKRFIYANSIIYIVFLIVFLGVFMFDPGNYISWFLD